MADGILHGIRIIDMSEGLAGSVATMLLAEAGADVIKVEPPQGAADRKSASFAVWNRSKRSIALTLPAERGLLEALIASADGLVHDLPVNRSEELGLGAEILSADHPGLIVCEIGGYPRGHDLEQLPVRDLLVLAEAGILDEQQGSTREGPVFVRFPLGSWGAAYLGAIGFMARLIHRFRGGGGGAVLTSLLQGALVPMAMYWQHAERPTPALTAGIPKKNTSGLFECADGVWIHLMRPPDDAPLMKAYLSEFSADELAAANQRRTPTRLAPNAGAYEIIMKREPSKVWLDQFWSHDIAAQPALKLGEIYSDPEVEENQFVADVDDPVFGRCRQPGHALVITPPMQIVRCAPKLDSDRTDILADLEPREPIYRGDAVPAAPLEGFRVLDFGWSAGPDDARRSRSRRYQDRKT